MSGPAIFISYRRKDSAPYARGIHERLSKRFGTERVFMDLTIPPGMNFEEVIRRAIRDAGAFVLVIGPNWLVDPATGKRRFDNPEDWVALEVITAMEEEDLVIPVLVGGADMPHREDLPDAVKPLARMQALEISDGRWDYDVGRLSDRLQEVLDLGGRGRGVIGRLRRWVALNRGVAAGIAAIAALLVIGGVALALLADGEPPPDDGRTPSPTSGSPTPTPTTLAVGSTGEDVRELEERLDKLGFTVGPLDDEFDAQTGNAVQAFGICWGLPTPSREADAQVLLALSDPGIRFGTDQDDDWTGTAGVDIYFGKDGNDTIDGGEGNDRICAGEGADVVRGGPGKDRLYGGAGDDQLFGDAGDDALVGFKGIDQLDGGEGSDFCSTDELDPPRTNCER